MHYHQWPASHRKGDQSCSSAECHGRYLLYNLEEDLGERHDLAAAEPAVLASMKANASVWFSSVERSVGTTESDCPAAVVPAGIVVPPFPSL